MKFFLEVNTTKPTALRLQQEIEDYIEASGADVVTQISEADVVLSLGGDGTILNTWRNYGKMEPLMFGVNCGTLGYLTEGSIDNWRSKLRSIIYDNYTVEHRLTLEGCIKKDGEPVVCGEALNDIVLSKKGSSMIHFQVFVNGTYVTTFAADGVICATPTGSTGYALSVGGSFIAPDSDMMELVAIAPHTLLNRSIILNSDCQIRLRLNDRSVAVASFDGADLPVTLEPGDEIIIKRSPTIMRMIRVEKESFVETISKTFSTIRS